MERRRQPASLAQVLPPLVYSRQWVGRPQIVKQGLTGRLAKVAAVAVVQAEAAEAAEAPEDVEGLAEEAAREGVRVSR